MGESKPTVGVRVGGSMLLSLLLVSGISVTAAGQEDWFRTGTGVGVEKIRLAVPSFQIYDAEQATLAGIFNATLNNDLRYSGLVELVSPSFFPLEIPSDPGSLVHAAWTAEPANAHMLAFGNMMTVSEEIVVSAWLSDVRNPRAQQVLAKRYRGDLTEPGVRALAHQFADDIIAALSGGQDGIARTQIAFVSDRTGGKEIWLMDYDGSGQKQITNCRFRCLTPRWSPDRSRIAYTAYVMETDKPGVPRVDVQVHSLLTGRRVTFPVIGGTTVTPAFSPDGQYIAFSSSRTGDPEIYTSRTDGSELAQITFSPEVDISPVWNPRTGAQIVFVSGRGGRPQIYIMNADGSNVERLTNGQGYAVEPAWSPNGQMIAFSWQRNGEPFNIYVLDIATRQAIQLTRESGRNEKPSWAPDGRHVVFESDRSGSHQVWSMLVDGTQVRQLTFRGENSAPRWSPR